MNRRLTTTLLGLALLGAGVVAAVPANAGTTDGTGGRAAVANCTFRQRHTFDTNTFFYAGDCYQTPAATSVMREDGNFVLYDASRPDTRPRQHSGHQRPSRHQDSVLMICCPLTTRHCGQHRLSGPSTRVLGDPMKAIVQDRCG